MESTLELTPAEQIARLIEAARRRAERDEWEQYEQENSRQLEELRRPDPRLVGPKPRGPREGVEHGTKTMYGRGCRCTACKTTYNAWMQEYRLAKGITKKPRPKRTHGNISMYNRGCRCAVCKSVASAYHRKRRERKRAEVSGRTQHQAETTVTHSNVLPVEGGHNQETL